MSARSLLALLAGVLACSPALAQTNPYETNLRTWGDHSILTRSVIEIAAADGFTLALQDDRQAVSLGFSPYGNLKVLPGLGEVRHVRANFGMYAFLLEGGGLVATNFQRPVANPTSLGKAKDVAIGYMTLLALREDGTVLAWQATGTDSLDTLLFVPPGLGDVVAIASGGWNALALRSDRQVIEWDLHGERSSNAPADLADVVAIAADRYRNYALLADGRVRYWGVLELGKTDTGTLALAAKVRAVAVGGAGAFFRTEDGRVYKASPGSGGSGFLEVPEFRSAVDLKVGGWHAVALRGDATIAVKEYGGNGSQVGISAGLGNVASVAGGYRFAAALTENGALQFWGLVPWKGAERRFSGPFKKIAGEFNRILALRTDGTVTVWGSTNLGIPNWDLVPSLVTVPVGLTDVRDIVAGEMFNLAVKENGDVVVWGDSSRIPQGLPTRLEGTREIQAFANGLIEILPDGTLKSWGLDSTYRFLDTLRGIRKILHGYCGTHALTLDGTVISWSASALCDSGRPNDLRGIRDIAAATSAVAALRADGSIVAWGSPYEKVLRSVPPRLPRAKALFGTMGALFMLIDADSNTTSMPVARASATDLLEPGEWTVSVHRVDGRHEWSGKARWDGVRWRLPDLRAGVHLLRIRTGSTTATRTVVVGR